MSRRRILNKDGTDPYGTEPFKLDVPVKHTGESKRRRTAKPMDYGKCPCCHAAKIAVLRSGRHWVWKEHTYPTYSRARLTCHASGIAVCELPEGQPSIHFGEPLTCPCEGKPR